MTTSLYKKGMVLGIIGLFIGASIVPNITGDNDGFYDDCESIETYVSDIISPPAHGMTGTYDITANFTTVGLIINGIKDLDENEPWIEHESSPDIDGTPEVEFYTSCDENFIYLAFENQTLGINSVEIFVDKNSNGIWDGVIYDGFYFIEFPDVNVKDHNGIIVENSIVSWGDYGIFVEIKIPKLNDWQLCNDWAFRVSYNDNWNPSWGGNDASSTPPDNGFLTFICDYGDFYSCPCGVPIRAWVDIYKINPGDTYTVYTADFENLADISLEWMTHSIDDVSDSWSISQIRSHSSSHSFHCTSDLEYYGNSLDILQMKNSFDFSDVNNVTFSFWHWCEGDAYPSNDCEQIADYGNVEIYTYIEGTWCWISLSDLGISNLYYDNSWIKTTIKIETLKLYPLNGEDISGDTLLKNGNKFRFVWKSDPQFQFEGWYIDDVEIIVGENAYQEIVFQTHHVPWCIPFGTSIVKTFPTMQWNANEEGIYLIRVCTQEEPPWCGSYCFEKIITIVNLHDIAISSLDVPSNIEVGDDLPIDAVVTNMGMYDEYDLQVKASIRRDFDDPPMWQQTIVIPSIQVSEQRTVNFIWEDATYCNYLIDVEVVHPNDEIPENNKKSEWTIVATSLFEDDMDDECCWEHFDYTGGYGHWRICTSGYDDYLWCGLPLTTKYGNNWNDIAMINESFDLTLYSNVYLNFSTFFDIYENDNGYIEISTDGGFHWYLITELTGMLFWTEKSYVIPSFYCTNDVKIRLRFYSDESSTLRGWIIDDVSMIGDGDVIFSDDFESNLDGWSIEKFIADDWWQRVEKAKSGDSNNIAYWCGDELTGMYPANLDNVLVLKDTCAIDLSKAFEAYALFSTWYSISDGDIGMFEISNDYGMTWDIISTFTGNSNDWGDYTYDLTQWVGDEIKIRFRFISDNSVGSEGWYIDDIKIVAKLDFDPPCTSCSIYGTIGDNDWYISPVTIFLYAMDDLSGVAYTLYRLDGGTPSIYTSPISVSTNGMHTIEYWSVDNVGNVETSQITNFNINIEEPDNEPPVIVLTNIDIILWPPNHKFHNISIYDFIEFVTDNMDEDVDIDDVEIYSVSSDEPENGNGDGNTEDDIVILGFHIIKLRAERKGNGNGRVYTINFKVSDASGNTAYESFKISCPHNQGSTAIDDGPNSGYTVYYP